MVINVISICVDGEREQVQLALWWLTAVIAFGKNQFLTWSWFCVTSTRRQQVEQVITGVGGVIEDVASSAEVV